MVKVATNGLMVVSIMEALKIINSTDSAPMNGPMEDYTKVIGSIIKNKAMVVIAGPMAAGMMAITSMTKSMGLESTITLMEIYTKVNGIMESNMEME